MHNRFKKTVLGVTVAGLMSLAGAAQATNSIRFNDQHGSGNFSVSAFDWSPDNALAQGVFRNTAPSVGDTFMLYTQGKLGNYLDASNNTILGTGLNSSYEITFQAGFQEKITAANSTGLSFDLATPAGSFFNIYIDDSPATAVQQLAGTGYGDGTLIFGGTLISDGSGFTLFGPTPVKLDQHGADNYPGIGTLSGAGGGQVDANVVTADTNYFKSTFISMLLGLGPDTSTNTSQITPFKQADPSALVVGQAPVFGVGYGGFKSVNGNPICSSSGTTSSDSLTSRCDFLFQADANTAFTVPEPGSLALMGLGLGLGGLWMNRKARRKARKTEVV